MSDIATKLTTIAENQQKVYDAGQEAGIQSEYDRFWDIFQQNGSRRNYGYAFVEKGWTNETFKPKYPIIATGTASYMFDGCGLTDYDFVEKGITLDLSGATAITYIFRNSKGIKRVGVIDATGCKDINRAFYGSGITTVDKLVVKETTLYDNTFQAADHLENITIEGCIGNAITIQWSPLTVESMKSIISALKDFTGTGNEYSQTVKFSDDCWAALEADSTAPDGGTWEDYVTNTLSWNT